MCKVEIVTAVVIQITVFRFKGLCVLAGECSRFRGNMHCHLRFCLEEGGSVCLRNVGTHLAHETVSQASKTKYYVCICMCLSLLPVASVFLYSQKRITRTFAYELTQPNNTREWRQVPVRAPFTVTRAIFYDIDGVAWVSHLNRRRGSARG